MIRHGWQVQRLREVLAQLVERCVESPIAKMNYPELDQALAQAALVLRATDDGSAPCKEHHWTHGDGWSWCRRCKARVMVDPPMSPAELARESWYDHAEDDDRMHRGIHGGKE